MKAGIRTETNYHLIHLMTFENGGMMKAGIRTETFLQKALTGANFSAG